MQCLNKPWPCSFKSGVRMIMIMVMNCFCVMVDRRKAFSLISSRNHCRRSWPSWISDTPRVGFEPAQNLISGLVKWSCAVVITTTPRRLGIEWTFVRPLKSLKNCTLISSFCPKHITFSMEKYRRVRYHDTEEWCSVWSKNDPWFQKWREEFFMRAVANLKNFTLMCHF